MDVGQNGRPRGPQMEMSSLVLTIQLLGYLILTHTHMFPINITRYNQFIGILWYRVKPQVTSAETCSVQTWRPCLWYLSENHPEKTGEDFYSTIMIPFRSFRWSLIPFESFWYLHHWEMELWTVGWSLICLSCVKVLKEWKRGVGDDLNQEFSGASTMPPRLTNGMDTLW